MSKEFKSMQRLTQECLLGKIDIKVGGRRRKISLIEAILVRQTQLALQGDQRSGMFVVKLAEKYLSLKPTLSDLMGDRPIFEWSEEDVKRFTDAKLLEGITKASDDEPSEGI
jgi:hypothetical protein